MKFKHVVIKSLAAVEPPIRVTSREIEQKLAPTLARLGIRDNLLEDVSGIGARRFWERGTSPSDAATLAAEKALDMAGIDRAKIGVIINTSVCRDYLEPSTACIVHGNLGLADLEIYRGNYGEAISLLEAGVATDLESGNQRAASTKYIALAEAHVLNDDPKEKALEALDSALATSTGLSQRVGAALNYIALGEANLAREIAAELSSSLQPQSRAYGAMITGMLYSEEGQHVEALDTLMRATQLSDFWLVRFKLGKAYLSAGSFADPPCSGHSTGCGTGQGVPPWSRPTAA